MPRKAALVIGNSAYQDATLAQLQAPDADVRALSELLRHADVGQFDEVQPLVNASEAATRRAIAAFFARARPDDLLLLYFSGHGVLDDKGRLYLAAHDTQRDLPQATAISAAFITDAMDSSPSRRQVLILDCCHSGAFARGARGGTEVKAVTAATFEGVGYGRAVLTATDATQYAWEGAAVMGTAENSVFTHCMIEGLRTGAADTDQDGEITLEELYTYIYEEVVKRTPKQTPRKWSYNQEGEFIIAHNPRPQPRPAPLPDDLQHSVDDLRPWVREGALLELERWLNSGVPSQVLAAQAALQKLTNDDSRRIAAGAAQLLAGQAAQAEQARAAEAARFEAEQAEQNRAAQEQREREQQALAARAQEAEAARAKAEQAAQAEREQQAQAARAKEVEAARLEAEQAAQAKAAQAEREQQAQAARAKEAEAARHQAEQAQAERDRHAQAERERLARIEAKQAAQAKAAQAQRERERQAQAAQAAQAKAAQEQHEREQRTRAEQEAPAGPPEAKPALRSTAADKTSPGSPAVLAPRPTPQPEPSAPRPAAAPSTAPALSALAGLAAFWLPVGLMALAWALSRGLAQAVFPSYTSPERLLWLLNWLGGGALGGWLTGLIMRRFEPRWSARQTWHTTAWWAAAWFAGYVVMQSFHNLLGDLGLPAELLDWPISAVLGGLGGWWLGLVWREVRPGLTRSDLTALTLGWAGALLVAAGFVSLLAGSSNVPAWSVAGLVIGGLGGLVTAWVAGRARSRPEPTPAAVARLTPPAPAAIALAGGLLALGWALAWQLGLGGFAAVEVSGLLSELSAVERAGYWVLTSLTGLVGGSFTAWALAVLTPAGRPAAWRVIGLWLAGLSFSALLILTLMGLKDEFGLDFSGQPVIALSLLAVGALGGYGLARSWSTAFGPLPRRATLWLTGGWAAAFVAGYLVYALVSGSRWEMYVFGWGPGGLIVGGLGAAVTLIALRQAAAAAR